MRLTGGAIALVLLSASSAICQTNSFQGSVAAGVASPTPLQLTLHEAIERGLKTNLGLLTSDTTSESSRGARLTALSDLMPKFSAGFTEQDQQSSLKTIGFNFHFPGVNIPTILGPFHYTDVRAYASWTAYDYTARKNLRASAADRRAAQLSALDARDLVVDAVANGYLQIIADASRVEAIRSQVETSQALYDRAKDQQTAGTAAGIDLLRSQVELKQQQQRLLAQQNQLEKDKLALTRVIGLPPGQEFALAENAPFSPLNSVTQEDAIKNAMQQRQDLQSYRARVEAAEATVAAARGEHYPTASINADFGDVGATLASSHETFSVTASARITVFDGGKKEGDLVQARAALKQRQDELADLSGEIDREVRAAFLDIRTASDQVTVATDNLDLANQTLEQARDRFTAGVTDNIEVVQAQESVATANDEIISALYAHNLAKVALARAMGGAEQGIQKFLPAARQSVVPQQEGK